MGLYFLEVQENFNVRYENKYTKRSSVLLLHTVILEYFNIKE